MKTLFIVILVLLLLIHFFVLAGFIPYKFIWGGRLKNTKEMYRFESFSVLLNLLFLWLALETTSIIKGFLPAFVNVYILFAMGGFFIINIFTISNSGSKAEKSIFIPLATLLAFCAFYIANQLLK